MTPPSRKTKHKGNREYCDICGVSLRRCHYNLRETKRAALVEKGGGGRNENRSVALGRSGEIGGTLLGWLGF